MALINADLKVSIVGGAPTSQYLAPQKNEVWVLGNQFQRHSGRHVTKVFEIHDDLSEHDDKYSQWLVDQRIPLVVGAGFPHSSRDIEVFPFRDANALMGEHLTSSCAYMMAYAILKGATHIGIYGVDMSVDDFEYFYQRPAMYAWIAFAMARGIKVHIPDESSLFNDTHVEGKGSGGKPDTELPPFTEGQFMLMADEHSTKMAHLQAEINNLEVRIHTHNGSKQSYERLAKVARAVESGQTIDTLTKTSVII